MRTSTMAAKYVTIDSIFIMVLKVKFQLLIPLYGGKFMSSETTAVAVQCRLQEWATQIKECQNRPTSMSVVDCCVGHGITKANYYYRLRRVREGCLESLAPEAPVQQIVPVTPSLLQEETQSGSGIQHGISVSVNGFSIHITESTPMPLLAAVLGGAGC